MTSSRVCPATLLQDEITGGERIDQREIADRLKQPLKIEYETPNEIAHP